MSFRQLPSGEELLATAHWLDGSGETAVSRQVAETFVRYLADVPLGQEITPHKPTKSWRFMC